MTLNNDNEKLCCLRQRISFWISGGSKAPKPYFLRAEVDAIERRRTVVGLPKETNIPEFESQPRSSAALQSSEGFEFSGTELTFQSPEIDDQSFGSADKEPLSPTWTASKLNSDKKNVDKGWSVFIALELKIENNVNYEKKVLQNGHKYTQNSTTSFFPFISSI